MYPTGSMTRNFVCLAVAGGAWTIANRAGGSLQITLFRRDPHGVHTDLYVTRSILAQLTQCVLIPTTAIKAKTPKLRNQSRVDLHAENCTQD